MLRRIGRSIRYKLVMVVLATTTIALLVAGAALVIYDLRTYQEAWVTDLSTQAEILGRASAPALAFNDPKSAREYLALLKVRPEIAVAAIAGSAFYAVIALIERAVTFWHPSVRGGRA